MKLPFGNLLNKKKSSAYFLALLLRDENATAVIFEEFDGKAKVIGEAQEHFSTTIETASLDEWLELLDKVISKAESGLPSNIETHKTIFGLKETWLDDSRIKNEYKVKLKKVCETLDLSPIGFLVIHEAITHLLQEEEGAPVSAILIEVGSKDTAISLLRAGKVIETKRTKIEDSLPKTTDRILHLFTRYEVLPSRIIIFNGKDSIDLTQEFIGHSWSKSLPFLHVPQISMLPKGFDAKAVLFGAVSQMGFSLEDTEIANPNAKSHQKETVEDLLPKELPAEKDTVIDTLDETDETHFGFVQNKDVIQTQEKSASQEDETPEYDLQENAEFDNIQEVNASTLLAPRKQNEKDLVATHDSKEQEHQQKNKTSAQYINAMIKLLQSLINTYLSFLTSLPFLNKENAHAYSPRTTIDSPRKKLFFILPPVLLLIVLAGILFYIFKEKSIVTLVVTPKIAEKTKTVTFSSSDPTDFAKAVIAAETISDIQDGTVSKSATGSKTVGEKAKGSVIIYNSDLTAGKTFPAGTTLTTNSLTFTLDAAVSIASASGDASDIKASTTKVNVTAKDPGKESNLPSGTKFTVGSSDTSVVIAKNESAFSGGSKKEVTVVAQKDHDALIKNLTEQLQADAANAIKSKTRSGLISLPIFITTTVSKKNFSKDVGDETNTVSLTATITFETLAYSENEVKTFANTLIQSEIGNMQLTQDGVHATVKDAKATETGDITATIQATARLLPTIDQKKLSEELAGKSFQEATELLTHVANIKDVSFALSPPIPFLPQSLSKKAENIFFQITHD